MANNLLDTSENIFIDKYIFTDTTTNTINNDGVIIIDPNKIIKNGQVADRYVAQENLVMYANLKAFKRPATSVFFGETQNNGKPITVGSININMLNPIKAFGSNSDGNSVVIYKNKLTTDYTDFFSSNKTLDAATGEFKSTSNIQDPETFGIDSISISQNPSTSSIVKIQFTDVQGRTLFERGNDIDNPYNLFYTFPYPTFVLTVKGFYGKAIDYPLNLVKSNTKFDPETGNYTVDAEFVSRTFSIFNSFLLIYAYVAPFMFKKKNGKYLGYEILEQLYKTQNDYFTKQYSNDQKKLNKYIIDLSKQAPTLPYLYKIKDNLDKNMFDSTSLLGIKDIINSLDILKTISDAEYANIVTNEIGKSQEILNNGLQHIDNSINDITDTDTQNKLKSALSNQTFISLYPTNVSDPSATFYDTKINNNGYTQFTELYNKLIDNIAKIKSDKNNALIDEELTVIQNKIGFQPNTYNIYRILFNNIQTFLILLNIAGKKALYEFDTNKDRNSVQKESGEYENVTTPQGVTQKFYPFPNYFFVSYDQNDTQKKVFERKYPGLEQSNKNWSEVQFVDEIYKSIDAIKKIIVEPSTENTQIGTIPAVTSNTFYSGVNNIYYNSDKQTQYDIIYNMINSFNLNMIYSGLLFKNYTTNDYVSIIKNFANFELDIFTNIGLKTTDPKLQLSIFSNIKQLLDTSDSNGYYGIIKSKIINNGTVTTTDLDKVITNEISLINGSYTTKQLTKNINKINSFITNNKNFAPGLNIKFLQQFYNNNSPLIYNNITQTPYYDISAYGNQSSFFVPPNVKANISKIDYSTLTKNIVISGETNCFIYGQRFDEEIKVVSNTTVVSNINVDSNLKSYTDITPTLTYTINNKDTLLALIGFKNDANNGQTRNVNLYNF